MLKPLRCDIIGLMQDTIPFLTTIITKAEADEMNPLVLAFVGDSVQQLYVRTRLAISSDKNRARSINSQPRKSRRKRRRIKSKNCCRVFRKKRSRFTSAQETRIIRRRQKTQVSATTKSKRIRGSSRIPVSHGKTRPPERIAFNRIRRTHVNYGKKRSV